MAPLFFPLSDTFCITMLVAVLLSVMVTRRAAVMCALTAIAGLLLIAQAVCGWGTPLFWHVRAPLAFAYFPIQFRMDGLSAIFIALLGVQTVAISLFSAGYLKHAAGRISLIQYWAGLFVFILSMALTLLSADAVSFIVFWELMSLSSAALVACEHKQHKVQEATLVYVGATRIATAFLAGGFLWMHALSHSWEFAQWSFSDPQAWWAAALITLGFVIKAGLWPFHIWLPYAHPAAPAPVSALMSGVMIKIAWYGVIRLLVMGGLTCTPLTYLLIALGTICSFWGIVFGLVHSDLKRALAYSSVENTGLICVALGVALHAQTNELKAIAGIALAAALLHIVNHGIFKSLLFLGAGAIDSQAHTRDLHQLGGLGKRLPWTMLCFLIGGASICALPPLNGFAGKWMIYQSLLHMTFESTSLIDRSIAFVAIGVLALVGGLSLTMFAKAIGVAFLGNPRSHSAAEAVEGTRGMTVAQCLLAAICLLLGVCIQYALPLIDSVVVTIYGAPSSIAGVFSIPIGWTALLFVTLAMLVYVLFLKTSKVREFITWECGYGDLSSRTQVGAESFSQPIAWIFGPLLRYRLDIEIRGKDRRHFPEYIRIEPRMASLLELRIYRPALGFLESCSKALGKLQAGSIHLYLLYVCITLVVLLFVGTKL